MNDNKIQDIFRQNSHVRIVAMIGELEPKLFSFNSPAGACESCDGLGVKESFDPSKIIVNQELSLLKGAIYGWDDKSAYYNLLLRSLSDHYKVDLSVPYRKLPKTFKKVLFYGSEKDVIKMKYVRYGRKDQNDYVTKEERWEGILNKLSKQYERGSYSAKERLSKYLSIHKCENCSGTRLNEKSRNVFISNKSISDITSLTIEESYKFFSKLQLKGMKQEVSEKIIIEITSRLSFLNNVGLNYLTLDRSAETLSGGGSKN